MFNGIDKKKDGGYIVCGNVMNQPKAKAWAVKTDSMGCVSSGCPSVSITVTPFTVSAATVAVSTASNINSIAVTEEFTAIKLAPNPVIDFLKVEITGVKSNIVYQLVLSDVSGRIINTMLVKNGESIDLRSIEAGVYFINVATDGKKSYSTKLIKQ